jgi:hypothetical protein
MPMATARSTAKIMAPALGKDIDCFITFHTGTTSNAVTAPHIAPRSPAKRERSAEEPCSAIIANNAMSAAEATNQTIKRTFGILVLSGGSGASLTEAPRLVGAQKLNFKKDVRQLLIDVNER